jgi:N-acetylmuramoyl-L-alanine amidase
MSTGQWHIVRQGECLASIACEHGFADWREVYDHEENAALREQRPNAHILLPGDRVFVPARDEGGLRVERGQTHRFRGARPRSRLSLHLRGDDGQPVSGRRYTLEVAGESFAGTTGADGAVDHSVDARARQGTLRLYQGDTPVHTMTLAIGHLDPVDTESGAHHRLTNLGYARSDELDERLRAFQRDHGLPQSGALDAATRAKLSELHQA